MSIIDGNGVLAASARRMAEIPPSAHDKLDTAVPGSTRSLALRVVSSIVLIPIVFFAIHLGGRLFAALIAFAVIVMVFEWTRMVERREFSSSFYALSIVTMAGMFAAASSAYLIAFGLCILGTGGAFLLAKKSNGLGIWSAFAGPYILAPSIALLWLRLDVEHGRALTFLLFIVVWAADIGAFVFGKLIGGPKISYALSPSKTWAGIGGGVIAGVVGGAIGGYFLLGPTMAPGFAIAGGILGAFSVLGDLLESKFKRNFGVKDISGFIPGHGGALDRMDGMIFATAAMTSAYFLYMLWG